MYTPGPWKVVFPEVLATDPRATIVCSVTGAQSNDQAVADANLIAAAPALLEALENMLSWADEQTPITHLDKARAAIAQAKGEIR